jgi:excisionase family DNA binding protein
MTTAAAPTEVRFMGYKAAAIYCGMSEMTLRRLVEAGKLKTYRPTGGRLVVFDRAELDALIHGSGASSILAEEDCTE